MGEMDTEGSASNRNYLFYAVFLLFDAMCIGAFIQARTIWGPKEGASKHSDDLGEQSGVVWIAWRTLGYLYLICMAVGLSFKTCSSITALACFVVDVAAAYDSANWSSTAYVFLAADGIYNLLCLQCSEKVGAFTNATFVFGVVVKYLATMSPIRMFTMAWVGGRIATVLHICLIGFRDVIQMETGLETDFISMAVA